MPIPDNYTEVRKSPARRTAPKHVSQFCCGVIELHGIHRITADVNKQKQVGYGTAKEFLIAVIKRYWGTSPISPTRSPLPWGNAIFNEAFGLSFTEHYGEALKNYIEEYGLGLVTKSYTAINPNTQRAITTYVWTIDHVALKSWWNANKLEETKSVQSTTTGQTAGIGIQAPPPVGNPRP